MGGTAGGAVGVRWGHPAITRHLQAIHSAPDTQVFVGDWWLWARLQINHLTSLTDVCLLNDNRVFRGGLLYNETWLLRWMMDDE